MATDQEREKYPNPSHSQSSAVFFACALRDNMMIMTVTKKFKVLFTYYLIKMYQKVWRIEMQISGSTNTQ